MTTATNHLPGGLPVFARLLQLTDEVWQIEKMCRIGQPGARVYPLYSLFGPLATPTEQEQGREWLGYTLSTLQDEVDGNVGELTRQCALLYFRSYAWYPEYAFDYDKPEVERLTTSARGEITLKVLFEWLRLHSSTVSRSLLIERIEALLQGPGTKRKPDLYPPTLHDCLDLLIADDSHEAAEILEQIFFGERGTARTGSVELPELRRIAPLVFLRLQEAGEFNYQLFQRAMYSFPGIFKDVSLSPGKQSASYRTLPIAFIMQLQNFKNKFVHELVEKISHADQESEGAASLLKQVSHLEGYEWLGLACTLVEQLHLQELPKLRSASSTSVIASAITRLCSTVRPTNLPEPKELVQGFLSQFSPQTLQIVAPHSPAYRALILKVSSNPT